MARRTQASEGDRLHVIPLNANQLREFLSGKLNIASLESIVALRNDMLIQRQKGDYKNLKGGIALTKSGPGIRQQSPSTSGHRSSCERSPWTT